MRPEQAAIGEQTAKVQVGVEGLDVLQNSCDISNGLVQGGLLLTLGDLRDGVGETLPNRFKSSLKQL